MKRLALVLVLLVMHSCARKENPLKDLLPVQVQREYVLKETHSNSAEQAPEIARKQQVIRWETAVYRAKEAIQVDVYEMKSEGNAFEMMQKWNKSEGVVFFQGPYFVVVNSQAVPRNVLLEFTQDLQTKLKP